MKIQIITKTKTREEKVVKITDSVYEVSVKALPIKGRANEAVIKSLAKYFAVRNNQIEITSGFTTMNKVIEVTQTPL